VARIRCFVRRFEDDFHGQRLSGLILVTNTGVTNKGTQPEILEDKSESHHRPSKYVQHEILDWLQLYMLVASLILRQLRIITVSVGHISNVRRHTLDLTMLD